MQTGGMIRACLDVHRIGRMVFGVRKFVIEHFMKAYLVTQKYQHRFGIHTFHLMTNNHNRAWLVSITKVYLQPDQVGGFSQVIDKTFVLSKLDFALVPSFMYPKNKDFSFLNLQTMFMWMSSYPQVIMDYGFTPVVPDEYEFINVQDILVNFLE